VNPTPDHLWGPPPAPPARSRLGRRLALAGGVGAVLAVGGVAVAQASSAPSPSTSPSAPAPSGSGSAPAPAPREHRPHLAGTVVSASGDSIVITDREGFQRTIHTSSATKYEDGLTATPAAGTEIVAEGTVDSDKTSLAATRIAKRPTPPEGGPGRGHWPGGGPGHGWPGRGDHPAPPPGAPSGAPTPPSGAPTPPSGAPTPPSGAPTPPSGSPAPSPSPTQ
jgi:hypothetical protein